MGHNPRKTKRFSETVPQVKQSCPMALKRAKAEDMICVTG